MDRLKKGWFTGVVGLACNLCLSAVKFTVGFLSMSISIQADAVNNLMDAVSSLTSMIGFKVSGRYADKEHPFGHGRMEYICGFIVSFLIVFVGFEFLKTSVERIVSPVPVTFTLLPFFLLLLSILVKLGMGIYYLKVSRQINSIAVKASAVDSFSDCVITSITVIAFAAAPYTALPVDGIAGIAVALFILAGGIKLIKELLNPLLGCSPDKILVDKITSLLTSYEHILGVHDLIIHDYGPGKFVASAHAEIPQELGFMEAHSLAEAAEKAALEQYGISLVIHGDPVDVLSPELQSVRYQLKRILREIDDALAYHDLRLVPDRDHTDVMFDLVIPFSRGANIDFISEKVSEKLKEIDRKYDPVITADRR